MWEEESKKFDKYNAECERIKKSLLTQLGEPTSADTTAKTVRPDRGAYFTRNTLWETESVHANLNKIFASMTYRVRFTSSWFKGLILNFHFPGIDTNWLCFGCRWQCIWINNLS